LARFYPAVWGVSVFLNLAPLLLSELELADCGADSISILMPETILLGSDASTETLFLLILSVSNLKHFS
jgi:hypothetical protein